MMTAKEIRESYKQFFKSKEHLIVPSAPMVVKDDPTLMFTNAGMNQFKDIILGNAPAKSKRVADSQKCLRVSGKHNDLEEVGHDTYHHTMFEMLGNWSFGDYFKKEAIEWAWEYLVDVLKIDPKNLYATVFEGSAEEGLERDNEAAEIWAKFIKAVNEYELIKENDKIMVCISGGKDSFLLAKLMQEILRHGKLKFECKFVGTVFTTTTVRRSSMLSVCLRSSR